MKIGDRPRRCSNFQVDSRVSFDRKGILGMIQRKLIDKALRVPEIAGSDIMKDPKSPIMCRFYVSIQTRS